MGSSNLKKRMYMGLAFLISILSMISCGKKNEAGKNNILPANLLVTATVSADNSGNVSFTSSADNAVSYDYDFGNGIYQTVPSGNVTYKYPASGNYTVNVTAK